MRIAVVNNFFPPRPGGSSHLAAALAERYAAAGHEVLVLTAAYRDTPAEEVRDGYRVVRLPAMPMPKLGLSIDFDMAFALARPGNLRRVSRLLAEFKPDVIHQHGQFFDLSWISGWYARRHRVPVLLSIHTRLESPDPKYAALFRMLDRFMVKPIIRRFRPRYVIMDELAARYCAERYGATTADFDYIPVAVEPSRFDSRPETDVRARHGVGDVPLIVSLGHVIPLRDRLALVEALPTVLAKHPDTKVMIIGRVYFDAFARRAAQLGVSDAIITTGAVPSADVPAYFAAADVVAHDLQGGGFGTASLEAMAAGRATIGTVTETNFPAVHLRNWENFVLVRPNDPADLADAVIRLFDEPEEREWIAKRQRDLVYSHFTLDVVTRKHLDVFERMVGERA
ncbi:GDP-mannose-dependent alpha-(1-6)-phosphatidylinositol monomannoside mannosyltransferase [Micromonospora sp. MW-13]|uniref:glycosyltransferase family 4 protein n=1 Tax=unclassified Micromonospora TaxID=2617518 RepID=UPI000EEDD5E4|nr:MULTISPECIES: glycosyltransferase family 4 protein [unclassified Micromonospora]MCX4473420.1 glycosyltransferase family 4 protein [Micromonospora sp. NBC_01655]RGC67460.1 GDP-mannose-dependent alpha-(1-6)-phosphatidylinositol monomannoside mannosyltransferase [Micromonospora sp. MW-13]